MVHHHWQSKNQRLLYQLKKYGSSDITVRSWDELAERKGLSRSSVYIQRFGTFNEAKIKAGFDIEQKQQRKPLYTKQEILSIIKQHKEALADQTYLKKSWESYRKNQKIALPTYQTIMRHLKYDELNELLQRPKQRYNQSDEQDLIQIAKLHAAHFTTHMHWDMWAKKRKLPTSDVYIYHFNGWEQAKRKVFGQTSKEQKKEELKQLARLHSSYFTTTTKWDQYAKKENLPRTNQFIYHFGTWKEAKKQCKS
ncbi:hypothetical protein GCM10011351_20760 [Paraliobacillus quinghaiensis]|uniref:Uncharacterized protein n=1 Tax=Paraliobacillus quinghaiensis TaxID=470815 RepID=A0A917TRD3_9BACI|nr:hypothetical protein [Paraliobacillus quinghaiensis]GGM34613.1 hypothetical protein GCM10011351_20760 [Paraliobacillus quinghaiensis]